MRVIKPARLKRFWTAHPRSEEGLRTWLSLVEDATWRTPADVRALFGARVDFVPVDSGNTVAVFDVCGNHFRLVTAVHYDYPRVFVLRILTHREYDSDRWKREL